MPGIVPIMGEDADTGMPVPMYDPNSRKKQVKAIDEAGDKERVARQKEIDKRQKYYDGDQALPLVVEPGEIDENIIVNVYGLTIDKLVKSSRVPTLEVEGGIEKHTNEDGSITKRKSPEQEALDRLLEETDITELVPNALESSAIAGHCFYRIVLPEEGDVTLDNPPHLELVDPRYVTTFWHMATRKLLWYRLSWTFGDAVMRQDIVPVSMVADDVLSLAENTPDVSIDGWVIIEQRKKSRSAVFEIVAVDTWDYPFPPIVDGKVTRRAHTYYGRPLIKSTRPQDAINLVASNTGRIITIHGHPKMFLFGDELGNEVDMRIDGIIDNLDKEARIEQMEMISDLSSSINFYRMLREAFFTEVGATDPTTVKDKIGAATNFVIRMLYDDQIETVTELRRKQGAMLTEAFRRMLYVIGIEADVMDKWPPALPENREETLKNAETEQGLKITSDQTLADEIGRDYADELERRRIEQQNAIDEQVEVRRRVAEMGLMI
ncbi:hypothetical protein G4Y79_20835 [Phototrophicus methaneseepsis]|uniref:Phage portal protein n=1 Tax=Phototrophicus methaneseepsis TaxID=2710758 RepID=A0A7S8E8A1_9CHLR|nr:hypothetical protein [Phototrophicus methaneseepsis]QPC82103.1 hypothetical protein G4Y79_20835 [Phototrophicus methaneseepsis]